MVESSVEHAMDDFDARRWIETKLKAEDLLKAVKQSLEDCEEDIGPDYTAEIQQAVDALNQVLARENADKNTGDVDALKQAITLLDSNTQKLAEVQMDKITEQLMNQQHQ